MSSWLSKESGNTEGACGKILDTDQPSVVLKKVHRRRKNKGRCSHNAVKQCEIQAWAHSLLTEANGFSIFFTPRSWGAEKNEYFMERIDCSQELNPNELSGSEEEELRLFYVKAKSAGIFPCDYEIYRQSDGRIALIDFDKFAIWKNESVVFPWGVSVSDPIYPWTQVADV